MFSVFLMIVDTLYGPSNVLKNFLTLKRNPKMRLIFVSGYGSMFISDEVSADEGK